MRRPARHPLRTAAVTHTSAHGVPPELERLSSRVAALGQLLEQFEAVVRQVSGQAFTRDTWYADVQQDQPNAQREAANLPLSPKNSKHPLLDKSFWVYVIKTVLFVCYCCFVLFLILGLVFLNSIESTFRRLKVEITNWVILKKSDWVSHIKTVFFLLGCILYVLFRVISFHLL